MRTQHAIMQTGQLTHGPLRIGVFRTLADEDGPYAVLRLSTAGAEHTQEVTMRPGDVTALEGIGDLLLLATEPSTWERRGAVRLALESAEDGKDERTAGHGIDEGAAHG